MKTAYTVTNDSQAHTVLSAHRAGEFDAYTTAETLKALDWASKSPAVAKRAAANVDAVLAWCDAAH